MRTPTADASGNLGKEPYPVIDALDRFRGHLLRARRSGGQHRFQFGRVGGQFVDARLERSDEFDDCLGGVLLQVAVAAPGVALDQGFRSTPVTADWMVSRFDTPGLAAGS